LNHKISKKYLAARRKNSQNWALLLQWWKCEHYEKMPFTY